MHNIFSKFDVNVVKCTSIQVGQHSCDIWFLRLWPMGKYFLCRAAAVEWFHSRGTAKRIFLWNVQDLCKIAISVQLIILLQNGRENDRDRLGRSNTFACLILTSERR